MGMWTRLSGIIIRWSCRQHGIARSSGVTRPIRFVGIPGIGHGGACGRLILRLGGRPAIGGLSATSRVRGIRCHGVIHPGGCFRRLGSLPVLVCT